MGPISVIRDVIETMEERRTLKNSKIFAIAGLAAALTVWMGAPEANAAPAADATHTFEGWLEASGELTWTPVDASARCVASWERCLRAEPVPGKARQQARKCDAAFRKCARKDKKNCKKACRDRKSAAKRACKAAFRDESCPNGGPARKDCLKAAKSERKDCMKAASENCNKYCK